MEVRTTMTRPEAIRLLRRKFQEITDDEHSICQVASRLGILCGGFSRWKTYELRERFDWIVKKRPRMTRAELEDLANRWELARQFVHGEEVACDVQTPDEPHRICEGWDTHPNEELARFVLELTGEEVEVVSAPAASA